MPGLPIAFGRQTHGLAAPCRRAARASANGDAGHQALHVPFPRAAGGLVEIVQIEHEVRLWRAVPAEVRDMGIAARLHQKPRSGQGGQVGGHGKGRAAEEGERRGSHAAMALGHEEGQPIGILLEERFDRLARRSGRTSHFPRLLRGSFCRQACPFCWDASKSGPRTGTSWVFAWRPATLCTSEEPVARLASPCPVSDLWSASAFLPIRLLPLRGRP